MGEARCHPCRRARPKTVACPVCGGPQKYAHAKTCSRAGDMASRRAKLLASGGGRRPRALRPRDSQRRFKGVRGRSLIAARDGWGCGICGEFIDENVRHPDPRSASVDHVVPLALGGLDTLENVRLAHLVCNASRGAEARIALAAPVVQR